VYVGKQKCTVRAGALGTVYLTTFVPTIKGVINQLKNNNATAN